MEDDPHEATAMLTGALPGAESGVMLTFTSSSSSLNDEDLFEPVSLRDLDSAVPDLSLANVSLLSSIDSSGELVSFGALSNEMHADYHLYSHTINPCSSTASIHSYSDAFSLVGLSPEQRGGQLTMPDIPPELVHLVDAVIMGRLDCMDNLKVLASGADSLEVSRFVVDALVATMGGVEGLDEMDGTGYEESTPSVMLTSRAATVAAELIPWLHCEGDSEFYMSPRTKMVKGLFLILNSCTRNRVMCSSTGLLRFLLDSAEKIILDSADRVRWNAWPLFYCVQVLGGHSLSVMDLERWLNLIKKSIVTEWALPLILSLENAVRSEEARGPATTFEFDGQSSGLLAPGENRWPFSNGYAFVTWIYMELLEEVSVDPSTSTTAASATADLGKLSSVAVAGVSAPSEVANQVSTQTPSFFSFVSADNQWVEAYFYGQFLVMEIGAWKGKKTFIRFSYEFKPQRWYFIGLEHSYKHSLLGKAESEVRLYIDGKLQETRPFELLRTSKPLSFCTIGTKPPPTLPGLQRHNSQCPLFAEMGPVYIFKEPIGPDIIARLASRGGDALPSFGKGAGLPWLAVNEHVRSLAEESSALDADIGGSLHLLYHPSLLSSRICPDASPSVEAGLQRRQAKVLGQVNVATRVHPAASFWALAYGGPMALLPMIVSDVQMDSLEPKLGDPSLALATLSLSASIFRIISMAIQHPRNNEDLCQTRAPELFSRILHYMLKIRSYPELGKLVRLSDDDLVDAVVSLCQCEKRNHPLKVQFFGTLLLDLKVWGMCNYGLQKKLLSSLADIVFTESSALRDANALQVLLDGCRRCFWVIHENDSIDTFSIHGGPRPIGEINALVDELLVVIELLMGSVPTSMANEDIRCLLGFLVDCPQPNQVARVLHLIYRLIVQPNATRAQIFAYSFISCGGVETLLVLLQREAKSGNHNVMDNYSSNDISYISKENSGLETTTSKARAEVEEPEFLAQKEMVSGESNAQFQSTTISGSSIVNNSWATNGEGRPSTFESQFLKNVGDIRFSVNAESSRSNAFNIDNDDGIVVAIINLLGALVSSGHLKLNSNISPSSLSNNFHSSGLFDEGSTMFDDKVCLLLFALEKAFQAAPQRLMTSNVHMAILSASVNTSSGDGLNIYDFGHHLEHVQLLGVLLRALPRASRAFQIETIQDLLFLACSLPENRNTLISMTEWPEWILEVLISNYEMTSTKDLNDVSVVEIEDLIHNFLIIIHEHSMRKKDGWKDVEATIHCAEWLSMVGGSSTGECRLRREEALPIFRRQLLGGLVDFSAWELAAQTQIVAAAAAGVAKASPQEAKVEAEHAAQLTVSLAENAIVILMLVEDHLRLQGQWYCSSQAADSIQSSVAISSSNLINSSSLGSTGHESFDAIGSRNASLSTQAWGVSFDVLASEADENEHVSAAVMERFAAAAAAEPFESVRCAFVSYGSCVLDLAKSWKQRSRMWYGVGLPSNTTFGAGASGWESWKSALEKDSSEKWIELPLVKKSIIMLQALLLDESGIGSGLGIGGGSGTAMGAMTALYHLLDSDQPFLCMLRMILLSMREEDDGEGDIFARPLNINDAISEELSHQAGYASLDHSDRLLMRKPRSALLWSVLGPLLNMPLSESKRQRVLVACCVLYSEVWHAIGRDRKPLRKQYVEAILPPFVAVLRRWRPILAGIHELTSSEVENPLTSDNHALSVDALPLEAAFAMISPGWSAAFASPPAAMALAMIAAGASGPETAPASRNTSYRRETSLFERKSARLHTFSSFPNPLETSNKFPPMPKDTAAALAAARDLERTAKIGSGRGLSAVAMATSAQRRSTSDLERSKRWNIAEAMSAAWTECLQPFDSRSVSGRDFSALCYKYVAVLVTSFASARNMQRVEMERLAQVDMLDRHRVCSGTQAWRKLVYCLLEMNQLFGHFGDQLSNANLAFWMLDTTENFCRMRRFLKICYKKSSYFHRDVLFQNNIQRKSLEESYDQADSVTNDLPCITTIVKSEAMLMEEGDEDDDQPGSVIVDDKISNQPMLLTDDQSLRGALVSRNSWASSVDEILVQPASVLAPGYVPGEVDERIILELPSLMVRPLKIVCGTFQITTKTINFIAVEHVVDESIAESLAASAQDKEQGKNQSWSISSLRQIFRRRYFVKRSALELFMADRSNYFFDFGSVEGCEFAFRGIIQARPPHVLDIFLTAKRPVQILRESQLMERWARWEISNFEYLMELNTLAGRTYNDITQYPIFPWILADYHCKTLNLEDPSSYRDLSKPIGALNPDRLKKFQEKYSIFDDPIIPKFHYGSHYSSARTVLYFLIRMEPFTTLSTKLGVSGRADQMFSSIGHSWNNVLEDMSDVKELVPELFYLPEILTNENNIDIGINQFGRRQDSVKLPPWADSPVDFIYKHHRALESEHVSSHLHEWIDLIFGYKQRGKEAVSANNVFFYTSYEGRIDIDKIIDPVHRLDARKQITYFGQMPSRLLAVPHLKRKPLAEILKLQVIFRNPNGIRSYAIPHPERCNVPAASIHASPDYVVIVDLLAPAANVVQHKWQPNTPDGHGNPFLFYHGKAAPTSSGGALVRMFKGPAGLVSQDWHFSCALAFATSGIRSSAIVAVTHDKEIITGGHADNSIKLISADQAKTIESASGHCAPVTCLALSPDSNYLVTGSRDTTVILWRIHRVSLSNLKEVSEPSPSPKTSISHITGSNISSTFETKQKKRIEGPMHVLRGHRGEVFCCAVNSDIGIIASSSSFSGVLLHSLRRGRLLRNLDILEAHAICLSSQGVVLIWNEHEKRLCTFTVNGIPIATTTLSPFSGQISCIEISIDGENALIGSSCKDAKDDVEVNLSESEVSNIKDFKSSLNRQSIPIPSICFVNLHSLKVFHTLALSEGQDITTFALSKDNTNLLVSTADKQLIVFTDPSVSMPKVPQHVNS